MRSRQEFERGHALLRLVAVGLLGSLAAACSSETMRFADSPFSNPFKSGSPAEPSMTGSLTHPVASAAPTMPVQSQPLPAIGAPQPAPVASQPLPAVRSTTAPAPVAGGPAGWTAQGGAPVTVGAGESLNAIANRYGVPAGAILSANGISSAAQVTPGRQIVIPVYNAGGGPAVAASGPAPTGQTRYRLVEKTKPAPARTASPTPAEAPRDRARPGMASRDAKTTTEQTKQKVAAVQARETAVKAEPAKPVQAAKAPEPVQVAKLAAPAVEAPKPVPAPVAVQPKETAKPEVAKPAQTKEPEVTASLPAQASAPEADFRWPARGRVIAGFGANGGNEGINIALPEGTPVKATESGTVTYAGSEVRGYGNLVLIKHDNGFVSAYAHNGELTVKRGEKVRRGQVIAKSGQTGNVTSPQLHFELRNGSKPVDPLPLLSN